MLNPLSRLGVHAFRFTSLSESSTIYLFISLFSACGMAYLHNRTPPILHRDLKSANLLIDTAMSTIKVADFGLARTREIHAAITQGRGTYQWMSPEVLLGGNYGVEADVFSFGVIMWECFAREIPFKKMSGISAAMKVANEGARPPIPSHTPPPVVKIMERCWHADVTKRPTFAQLVDELRSLSMMLSSDIGEVDK